MSQPEKTALLNGVRVLDLSQYIPGPYASLQLVELGAQVIKIEAPGGDPMRAFGSKNGELSSVYRYLNRGKKVVELNLKQESGRATFKKLLASVNILIEGFRPGTLHRLGFGPEALAEMNPQMIVCSLSGFGQDGPDALRGGHDLGYGACAGLYSNPVATINPSIVFPPTADHVGALQALGAILAALYHQEKTGQGTYLDMSLYEPVLAWQYLVDTDADCRVLAGDAAYYNIYETADARFVTLAALEGKFWHAFCTAVQRPEWVGRQAEPMPQAGLRAELKSFFASHPLSYWQALLHTVDCCFEVIPLAGEASHSAQTRAREVRNHFPGKINSGSTPALPEFETLNSENTNWINE